MGIRVSCKTKATATLKLYNQFGSYLFEQQYGELDRVSQKDKDTLKEALKVLGNIVQNN